MLWVRQCSAGLLMTYISAIAVLFEWTDRPAMLSIPSQIKAKGYHHHQFLNPDARRLVPVDGINDLHLFLSFVRSSIPLLLRPGLYMSSFVLSGLPLLLCPLHRLTVLCIILSAVGGIRSTEFFPLPKSSSGLFLGN